MYASNGGVMMSAGTTFTLTGTPAFSSAFIGCVDNGTAAVWSMSFLGSATGQRYTATNGGVINTNGGGASYFPGSSAGVGTTLGTSPYGLYV